MVEAGGCDLTPVFIGQNACVGLWLLVFTLQSLHSEFGSLVHYGDVL